MLYERTRALRLGLLVCALATGTAATLPPARAAHKVQTTPVAWVNGQPIQRTTLVELLNLRNGQADNSGRPLAPVTPADRQRALDDIIRMELVAQKARTQGLTTTPEAEAELSYQLDHVLGQRLLRQMAQEVQVDEAALRERHAAIPVEHELSVRHIVVPTEAAARDVLAKLKGGASFATLARTRSIDKESRAKGGLLDTAKSTAFVPPFAAAALALEPGQATAEPVETTFGWHVIRLESKRSTEPPTLEAAREWLVPQMVNEAVESQLAAWRQAADVKVLQTLGEDPLPNPQGDVATVNGRPISRLKFEQIVRARNGIENPYDPVDPKAAALPIAGREPILEELVNVQLLADEARARKLDENPSVAAEAELQTKTIAGRMYVRYLISQTQVRQEELKALYQADVPAHDFKLSQIVVVDEARAREVIAKLDRGARFATLAREVSIDVNTQPKGGSMGWLLNNQMPTAMGVAVRPLKPGQHTREPVRSELGWAVVRVDAHRPTARRPGLDEATAWLYPKLMHEKVQARVQRLRAEADIQLVQ